MLLAPLVMVCWLLLPAESREYASDLSASAHNVHARLVSIEFALAEFKTSPIYGVGVGLRKTYDATNLVMSTLAETGVLGLASFVSIFITLAGMAVYSARRLDADDLAFSLMVLGAGLVTCKLVHGMVDHYWGRGILPAWAGAGMVAFAYVRARALARRKAA
jgi:O-antigen ligase